MEKITLAGGTLMGGGQDGGSNPQHSSCDGHSHQHHHHSHHSSGSNHTSSQDPLGTPQPQPHQQQQQQQRQQSQGETSVTLTREQQVELSKIMVRPQQQQQHDGRTCQHHSHGHAANNWQRQAGGMQVPAAALSLMVPMEEILQKPPTEIMEALSTLLRLGQYEKWEALALKVMERERKEGFMDVPTAQPQTTSTGMDESDASASASTRALLSPPEKKSWMLWIDINGHTLLHWAAKRGDDKRFVEFFLRHAPPAVLQSLLHQTSLDNTAMTPLHWACTEPGAQSLGILSLFMNKGVNWETTDSSGCTPLLIAAQYGQVEVCAYLLQKGRADLYAMDTSLDTALHWAAYKGSLPVCGLLWWYHEQITNGTSTGANHHRRHQRAGDLMAPDSYGQTPLHLASLRGHTSVVRYLLQRTTATNREKMDLLYHKDTNGRTPLELAVHKHRPNVQVVLQEEQDKLQRVSRNFRGDSGGSRWDLWKRAATKSARQMMSLHAWKMWMGFSDHSDEMDEAPQFPYYYLWGLGLFHVLVWYPVVFCPIHSPQTGLLWDFPFWHLFNVMWMAMTMYCLHKTTFTNPGTMVMAEEELTRMPKQHKQVVQYWRKLYESTLDSYATTDDMLKAIQEQPLCHTCHIARPYRSKHCRVARSCVLMFDHHCPFVNNTVGLYNYPYFYVFLVGLAFYHIGFIFNLFLYVHRSPTTPWFWLVLGLFQCLHIIPTGGMFLYHTQLCMVNLTTNEHMNVGRYDYLMEKSTNSSGQTTRRYKNPWFKGYVGNFLDRMSPSNANYNLPQHHLRQQQQHQGNNNIANREEDDEEKQQRRALLSTYSTDTTV